MDGGEEQDFPWRIFYLTVPKKIVGEPFRVSLISVIEKFYASEDYVTIFCRNFCLTMPKNFEGEPFCAVFQNISGSQKVYGEEGGYQDFPSKVFLSHSAENFRRWTL